ncbi:uncharacterized protein B0T15DRAFT_180858 [Chaetomium strumarium]|uniref:Tafazzin n=1 Tax=Chaetomium strumarium TaxID=1170767 RepID=A0AAJ0GWX3_9PEZI|nr:hypothetical protein B0T15DRAFT_180858 [Chaetomium strumarium]
MPKKRRSCQYNKPPSTAPALLRSTAASRSSIHHDGTSQGRGVNELLSDLRRIGLSGSGQRTPDVVQPTVPPSIRQILQIPETPPPRPRRPLRVGAAGARLPAGPAPPSSWLSASERAEANSVHRWRLEADAGKDREQRSMPGVSLPARRSLVDIVLRQFARSWEWQKEYCRYHLYELPAHLRVALIAYLAKYSGEGVSLGDLKAVLLPPPDVPEYQDDPALVPSVWNESIHFLDLSWSLGRSLKLRELSDLLFPPQPESIIDPQESWDAPEPQAVDIPRPLLPSLTHLSLALDPASSQKVSWRQLLAFATHLPGLTHLSLGFWPEPCLTPNAKLTTITSPQTGARLAWGGTTVYSYSLDDDWAEAIVVLRQLSRRLYGLEYLDISGCGAWFPALCAKTDGGDMVDWAGAWGKITTLVLHPGYRLPEEDVQPAETARYWEIVDYARRVERHVRAQRKGEGRFITVETDKRPDEL